jgi:hypothetical protein
MKLNVYNCPDKRFLPYVKDATNFYAECLFPNKKLRNNINIRVKFIKKIDCLGYASILDLNASKKPRSFLIEVCPFTGAGMILSTLAHEMVHVKQYVNEDINDSLSVWKGTKVNSDDIDYWEQPWEVEAHGLEKGLFFKYCTKNELWNIFEDIENPEDAKEQSIRWRC